MEEKLKELQDEVDEANTQFQRLYFIVSFVCSYLHVYVDGWMHAFIHWLKLMWSPNCIDPSEVGDIFQIERGRGCLIRKPDKGKGWDQKDGIGGMEFSYNHFMIA